MYFHLKNTLFHITRHTISHIPNKGLMGYWDAIYKTSYFSNQFWLKFKFILIKFDKSLLYVDEVS